MRNNISVEVQSLLDTQDNPFVLIDQDYHVVAANKAYGIAEDGIIDRKCYQVSRRTDIPDLANTLLQRMGSRDNPSYRLTDDAIEVLLGYDYPGNVRELRNILQHAASLSTNGIITEGEIRIDEPIEFANTESMLHITEQDGQDSSIKGLESQYIAELLAEHHGKRSKVAQILGISERTLYHKLKQYGLQSIGRAG
jgi:DNA-binding NtrC family response regulator